MPIMRPGSVDRDGDRWRAVSYDDTGKRRSATGQTADVALARRARAMADHRSDQKLSDYLSWWLDEHLPGRIADGTFRNTTRHRSERDVRLRLLPHLGDHTLTALATRHVEDWMMGTTSIPDQVATQAARRRRA